MDLKTAALLNGNDPERLRVEQDVCQTAEGREEWLQAVREAEKLRVDLRSVSASPDAVARALQISRPKSRNARRSYYITGVAAAVVLSLGGWWLAVQQHDESRIVAAAYDHQQIRKIDLAPRVKQLALLAMENFEDRSNALTSAGDMETLLASLPESSTLPNRVPELAPLQELDGGKVVSVGNQPALLTRWKETVASGEIHDLVVQQFYAAELNLDANMDPVLVHIDPAEKDGKPICDVLVWAQDGVAYMLVAQSSDGCARRALEALKQRMGSGYPVSSST